MGERQRLTLSKKSKTETGEYFFIQRKRKDRQIDVFDVFILNNNYYHGNPICTFYNRQHAEEYCLKKNDFIRDMKALSNIRGKM